MIDTQAMCPSGFGCRDGQCILQCVGGEMPCPPGYKCVNQFCVPQRCQGVTCPAGERCDENTGMLRRPLHGRHLHPSPKTCIAGRCLDCNDPLLACTAPQICVAGRCQTDPCLNINCPSGQYCDDGACKDLCVPGKCSDKERCVAGLCQPDPCWNVPCAQGQFCNPAHGQVRDRSLPGDPVRRGHDVRAADQHLQARSLQDHRVPERLLDLQGDGGRHRHLHRRQRQVRAGQRHRRQKGGGNAGCSCAVGDQRLRRAARPAPRPRRLLRPPPPPPLVRSSPLAPRARGRRAVGLGG